jgi:hypothetical protein
MVRVNVMRTAASLAAATVLLAGCDSDTRATEERAHAKPSSAATVAFGAATAECEEAMPGSFRIGGPDPSRGFTRAGSFGLLQNRDGLERAQPAGAALGPRLRRLLVTKWPATVLGDEPVTVSIPAGSRDEAGLVFGSLREYDHPLAQVTFEPCAGDRGTSWPGGLVLKTREPVTLLVTSADGDEVWRLRAGDPERIPTPIAVGTHVARCDQAMIGNMHIKRRRYNAAGPLALLESPNALRLAHPAGSQLAPQFKDVLLTKIPATVLGTGPVTLSVPLLVRHRVGLLYGSLSGYRAPFSEVTFMPCPDHVGTSWPGGLALLEAEPVVLRVSTEGGDRVWWVRVGG